MTCDECGKCLEMGYSFCNKCGQDLSCMETSAHSGYSIPAMCGMVLVIIGMVANIYLVLANLSGIWDTAEGMSFNLYIFLTDTIRLCTVDARPYFIFLCIALLASMVALLMRSKDAVEPAKATKTPLFWLGMLICSVLFIEVVVNLLLILAGMEVVTPGFITDLTLEESVIMVANAAVWEEVAFRLVLIGIPMAVIAAACRRKDFLRCLLGGFGVSRAAMVLLVVSSLIFAFAHVDGWGSWKIFSVMFGGIAMGYLYIRFGIFASIMFHFLNDWLLPWSLYNESLSGIYMLALLLLGAMCLPLLTQKTWGGIKNLKTMENLKFYQNSFFKKD